MKWPSGRAAPFVSGSGLALALGIAVGVLEPLGVEATRTVNPVSYTLLPRNRELGDLPTTMDVS